MGRFGKFRNEKPTVQPFSWDERQWVTFAHASICIGIFMPYLGPVIGPVFILLTRGYTAPAVENEAVEALNFGATWAVLALVAKAIEMALGSVDSFAETGGLEMVISVYFVVFSLVAANRNWKFEPYRYPLTFRPLWDRPETSTAQEQDDLKRRAETDKRLRPF